MKVVFAASRFIHSKKLVEAVLEACPFPVTTLLSKSSNTADMYAERWAARNNTPLSFYRPVGEHKRTAQMVQEADALVLLRLNNSPTVTELLCLAKSAGRLVMLIDVKGRYRKTKLKWVFDEVVISIL